MANIITSDFGSMHDALNKIIINEVKAALRLLPAKSIKSEKGPLCRIVISGNGDYQPRDLSVTHVWLDGEECLHIEGRPESASGSWTDSYDEDDDMLDITDFQYLITQIGEKLNEEHDVRNTERTNLYYATRKIGDEIKWKDDEGQVRLTRIGGVIADQEHGEPVNITYDTTIVVGNVLRTVWLNEEEIIKD